MARFRAPTSDSEDEGLSDYSQDQEELEVAKEISSSLQDDHQSPRRYGANLADSDDDMYTDDDNNAADQHSSRDSSVSPPPTTARPADPTLIPWAREVGVDPQKMHVMQTALFRVPEEEAAIRDLGRLTHQNARIQRLVAFPPPLNRKHSRDSDGDGLRADSRQRPSFAHDIEPAPFKPTRKYARVEGAASAFAGQESVLVDSGLALGRSFRVGWGPGGTLVHLGTVCAPKDTPTTSANTSIVKVSSPPQVATARDETLERITKLLTHHLNNTTIDSDADGVPCANPARSLSFASFASLFPVADRSFEATLFRLGQALFDPIELRLSDSIGVDIRNRVTVVRRKSALSKWLQDAVASVVEATLRDIPPGEYDWAEAIFTLLTGNQIEKACGTAVDSGNVKLATLLAQAGGDDDFKTDLLAQLKLWREQRIDVHVDERVRKVYALLAGIVDVLEGSKGTGLERCPDIHLTRGMDWKRAFGLHLWFSEPMDAPISSAFEAYDRSRNANPQRVAQPVPWYREGSASPEALWKLPKDSDSPDALFSLIKLFADPACSLSSIFTPFSFSPSPSDYRLPWHLYILLSRCLRTRDFSDRGDPGVERDSPTADGEPEVEGHSPSADLLASSYALQLEQADMLQEAVFVLLHVEGSNGRKRAIKDMLARNAARLDDWMTRGLVGSLKIPIAWVNEAKAVYALNRGEVYRAYELYLAAGLYNPAHDLAVLELAPDAIIHRDLELLEEIFQRFVGHSVEDWHTRGKVFLDYVHAMTRMPELREYLDESDVADNAHAGEVDELTRSVPKMIALLPSILRDRSDMRHNAALAEMIAGLTLRLDQLRPLALGTQLRTAQVGEATKLHHIRATAYERFLRTIEVA